VLDGLIVHMYNKIKIKERGAARFPATVYKHELTKGARLMEMVGYTYNADNMNNTFKAGDKVYILPQDFRQQGQIMLFDTSDGNILKRVYSREEGGYILTDEKNPPEYVDILPPFLGVAAGFERLFDVLPD
jgi:hypothetical protein